MRSLLFLGLVLLSAMAFGQTDTLSKFEAADIHVTGETTFRAMNGPFIRATRFEVRKANPKQQ